MTTLRQRIELSEFAATLNSETLEAERKNHRETVSGLHARIRKLEKEIAEHDDAIDTTVVEVVATHSSKHRVVTLRTIVEDFDGELSRKRCAQCRWIECSGSEEHGGRS